MARVLIVTGDGCTPELDYAVFRMREEGHEVTISAPKKKRILTVFHQQEEGWDNFVERPWYVTHADAPVDEVDPSRYDGLLLPGGRAPVYLRNLERCTEVVRHFVETKKPVATICRGPLVLLGAGIKGRRLTGSILIKPRVAMGGCTFVETRGEPLLDGNILSVSGRPYYHVWVRGFLAMLKQAGYPSLQRSA